MEGNATANTTGGQAEADVGCSHQDVAEYEAEALAGCGGVAQKHNRCCGEVQGGHASGGGEGTQRDAENETAGGDFGKGTLGIDNSRRLRCGGGGGVASQTRSTRGVIGGGGQRTECWRAKFRSERLEDHLHKDHEGDADWRRSVQERTGQAGAMDYVLASRGVWIEASVEYVSVLSSGLGEGMGR